MKLQSVKSRRGGSPMWDRQAFIRQHYGRSLSEPAYYDLLLNTGTIPEARAAQVVVAAYRAKFDRLPPGSE
ncbi:MAG: hypothetical protein JRI23_24570 [Deltaproteobacteria bacterium]|jgi:hypothetical protein|nr:hypothetical protein [Deltaproteobacteria bacterium]MBW2535180.1 hypothetical protein [Deltaproteobacteria bacterium]